MMKDGQLIVLPDEYDAPPPSKKSLGGEGDISAGEARIGADFSSITETDIPTEVSNPVVYVTAAGGITPNPHPFMRLTGSNNAVTISADPQIVRGRQNQVLTLMGVGSDITIQNGTGLATMASAPFVISSGSVITFMYQSGGTVWQETSRNTGVSFV